MNAGQNYSPTELKKAQQKRYDEMAQAVARGELGYQPVPKSKYSKSCQLKIKHQVEL